MKFLKNNMWTILSMVVLFSLVMVDPAAAQIQGGANDSTVFGTAKTKLRQLFENAKLVVFVIGGFGLVALAFQAIFGKVKWPWFAALAFGLAVVAAAGAVVNYATSTEGTQNYSGFNDSLKGQ